MKKFILLALFPACLFGQSGQTTSDKPSLGRKYSNSFLNIGVDARGIAMANSVVGSVDDATAGYWNPAGLAQIDEDWSAAAMHSEYFAGIAQYDYLSYAQRLDDQSSVGISLIRFGVDGILNTTRLIDENGNVDYDRITKFSAADYALLLSYARKAKNIEGLSYGGNAKVVYRHIGKFASAIGFGFDLGAQYHVNNWKMGASIRDVTTTFNSWTINEDELEPIFTQTENERVDETLELTLPRLWLGIGRQFDLSDNYSLYSEINLDNTFGGQRNTLVSSGFVNVSPGLGVEAGYRDFVFLRAGVGNAMRVKDFDNQESITVQPNLGLGFKYRGISIDYALTNIGSSSDVLYSNVFSLKFNFADFKKS